MGLLLIAVFRNVPTEFLELLVGPWIYSFWEVNGQKVFMEGAHRVLWGAGEFTA